MPEKEPPTIDYGFRDEVTDWLTLELWLRTKSCSDEQTIFGNYNDTPLN